MLTSRSLAALGSLALLLGCSGRGARVAEEPKKQASVSTVSDDQACDRICDASEACGDPQCTQKCNAWLVQRSRRGIASETAACAVPRIAEACAEDAAKGAARALVICVDEAGRHALAKDKEILRVAAHAICDRGARCGGEKVDASACVERMIHASPTPRGLGIFGAIRPEIVQDFATCMESTSCGASSSACFAAMMGVMGDHGSKPTSEPAQDPPSSVPETKI